MDLVLNGETATVAAGATVADVVALLTETPKGVAVAVDGAVVPRSAWADTVPPEGATVEVLHAAQGG